MEWEWIEEEEAEEPGFHDDEDYDEDEGPVAEMEAECDGLGFASCPAPLCDTAGMLTRAAKRKLEGVSRRRAPADGAKKAGSTNPRGARKKRCSGGGGGGGEGGDDDAADATTSAPAAGALTRRRKNPPRKVKKEEAQQEQQQEVKEEKSKEEEEERQTKMEGLVVSVSTPRPVVPTLLRLAAGQFVAVAADSQHEPFFLARLLEAYPATDASPGSPPSDEKRSRRRGGQRSKRTETAEEPLVRVQWLEPRPLRTSRGGSSPAAAAAGTFEEFVEAGEGVIPVESIMCSVYPEAQKGGGWRLGRRDKLRIFRVRVEDKSPVEWLTSHLLPDRIIWSSHPALLKPDIAFDFSAEEHLLQEDEEQTDNNVEASTPAAEAACDAETQKLFKRAARLLNEAPAVLVMAGAGMGKDSGLPDYRGAQGFWRSYPPLAKLGITFNESMDPSWFKQDPQQAWGFYGHRAELYSTTTPHAGFDVLRRLSETKTDKFFVATSNIDEHFQKAGFSEDRIYECHGSLGYLQCVRPCGKQVWRLAADKIPQVDADTLRVPRDDGDAFPRCPVCGDIARPNVSLASDTQDTWVEGRSLEQKKALLKWLKRVMRGLDSSDDPAATSPRVKEQLDSSAEHSALSSSVEQQNFRHQLEDNEEYEQLDEWREIRAKRKRKSESRKSGGEDGVESEKAEQESESAREGTPTQQRRRNTTKLVVIELGCGDSLHSLRIEAELMIRENPSVKLIRINPNFRGKMKRGHVAIKMGALEALEGISKHLRLPRASQQALSPSLSSDFPSSLHSLGSSPSATSSSLLPSPSHILSSPPLPLSAQYTTLYPSYHHNAPGGAYLGSLPAWPRSLPWPPLPTHPPPACPPATAFLRPPLPPPASSPLPFPLPPFPSPFRDQTRTHGALELNSSDDAYAFSRTPRFSPQ